VETLKDGRKYLRVLNEGTKQAFLTLVLVRQG
jgi:hypothetical protein